MTEPMAAPAGRHSPLWRLCFRGGYALVRLADPLVRAVLRRFPALLPRTVDVVVPGRRSGTPRSTLVTLITLEGRWYVGHPNGPAEWTRNLEVAGAAALRWADATPLAVTPIRLPPGAERERVVRATFRQQPFPANLVYGLARNHIRAVGVYFRLAPAER